MDAADGTSSRMANAALELGRKMTQYLGTASPQANFAVSTFWAGGALAALDRACVASFARTGHKVTLYSFDPIAGVPDGVELADARAIVPYESLDAFIYAGRPNLSHFSDYFRYKLFAVSDDVWIDADLLRLRAFMQPPGTRLFARETPRRICGAIMRIPRDDPRLGELLRRTEALMHTDLVWGATGPRLLNEVLGADAVLAQAWPEEFFFPVHFNDFFKPLLREAAEECEALCAEASTLHLWNNLLVSLGYWKELAPPVGSFLWRQLKALDLLSEFRDTYPDEAVRAMVTNWQLRKTGGDVSLFRLLQQAVPSVVRSVDPWMRSLRRTRMPRGQRRLIPTDS